jgi:hypothetical protein
MLGDLKFYQIAVALIAITMIGLGLERYAKSAPGQSFLKLATRIVIWGGMALVALLPRVSNYLAAFIGLEGNINAVILIGFILVFLIIFKILSVVERIEHDISVLTHNEALKKFNERHDISDI